MIELKEVHGIEEARAFLKELDKEVSDRIIRQSLRVAARPLIRAAKRAAPVAKSAVVEFWGQRRTINPGVLKNSITSWIPKRPDPDLSEIYIGPKKLKPGKQKQAENKNDAWYRHFIIRGTAGSTIKTGKLKGKYIKGQAANPFMDRAYSTASAQVGAELDKNITDAVNSFVKRKLKQR